MAKINFNNASLYIDGKKVPGVTDIQFDGKDNYVSKDSLIWKYKDDPSKSAANVYLDFEYDSLNNLVVINCKYQGKKSAYQLTVESLVQAYNNKDLLNYKLKELLSYLMVPENTPIKLNYGHIGYGLENLIKEWSMQFDNVSYNTEAIAGPSKETTIELSKLLPGVDATVACPACTVKDSPRWKTTLWHMIQHLNDQHEWSRESIADFLDELPDEIDITFKTKDKK